MRRERQASQGRREGAYLEGTCPTENAARRRRFALKTDEMPWVGPLLTQPALQLRDLSLELLDATT